MKKLLAIIVLGLLWSGSIFADNNPSGARPWSTTNTINLICVDTKIPSMSDTVVFRKINDIWHARVGNVVHNPTLKKDKYGGTSEVIVTDDTFEINYKDESKNFTSKKFFNRISGEMVEIINLNKKKIYNNYRCEKAERKF